MKLRKLVLLPAAAAAIAFGTPAIANSLTFGNVTFETQALGGDLLQLSILNATNADNSDDAGWSGINFLRAFEVKDIGTVTGATITSGPGVGTWSTTLAGLNSGGCGTGNSNGACFTAAPPVALSDSMIWVIDFDGTLNFAEPHLKVNFLTNIGDDNKTGSNLSLAIPAIPEPETYAMMLAGLGLLGFVARRRRQGLGNVVPA